MTDVDVRKPNRVLQLKPTSSVRRRLMKELESGVNPDTAADAAGITWPVLERWIDRGIEALTNDVISGEEINYANLVIEIRKALARFEIETVQGILHHGEKRSQSLEWLLERLRPDKFARPIRIGVGNAGGVPFRVEISALDRMDQTALTGLRKGLEAMADTDDIIDAEAEEV